MLEILLQKRKQLTIFDFDKLNPKHFEASIAAIWRKKGYTVILTPYANDKGADVISMSDNDNYLIQVKQSQTPISDSAIGEILKSKGYYGKKYLLDFNLCVVTNHSLTQSGKKMAKVNNISIVERGSLEKMIKSFQITSKDIDSEELRRMQKI